MDQHYFERGLHYIYSVMCQIDCILLFVDEWDNSFPFNADKAD